MGKFLQTKLQNSNKGILFLHSYLIILSCTPGYLTYRDKLRPYSWVGSTLLNITKRLLYMFWIISGIIMDIWGFHLQKLEPRRSWRKQCTVIIFIGSPILALYKSGTYTNLFEIFMVCQGPPRLLIKIIKAEYNFFLIFRRKKCLIFFFMNKTCFQLLSNSSVRI